MSDKEADEIAKPLARIVARSALMRVYGKYLAGSSDYVALGIGLYHYGERVWAQTQVIAVANMNAARESGVNVNGKAKSNGHESNGYAPAATPDEPSGPIISDSLVNYTPSRAD